MGTRMKSDLHKVLHPLAGRPMLFHLLDSVAALDPERQVVVAGARREQVESALAGLDVKLVTQEPQLGTAHAVLPAKGVLAGLDRKSVVWGQRVSVRVDLGGGLIIKKKK